ncbi:MAG TPA: acyl--CoA ligase [Dehalococcoidia bacterium]
MAEGPQTLIDLLEAPQQSRTAVIAPERDLKLSYADLRRFVSQAAEGLRALGVKLGDHMVLVAPNGPEFIFGYLGALEAGTACQPINPQLKPDEVDFAVEDSSAVLTLVVAGSEGTLHGTRVPEERRAVLRFDGGSVAIEGRPIGPPQKGGGPSGDSDALILYTSGTTSRPKAVPLTHKNLVTSARNVADSYQLTADDVTMLVMPLFHVHGLVAATFATLLRGGAIIAPPRFSASGFWDPVRQYRATWYTAVPTIHTILLNSVTDSDAKSAGQFRFVRSCSSALAAPTQAQYEETFGVPVLQAYGMTEAAHQIATNPLPPGDRREDSVGLPYGVDVAILGDAGDALPSGAEGEVALRGPNVTRGYLHNPNANRDAFTNGWFRTGDSGYIDTDGYIYLSGRLKELINRAGEKISPHEVDAALLSHPSVYEAVAIAVPHPIYGEEVEAVVALKPGHSADAAELISFCRDRIADFKVPKAIRFVAEVPRSATGKIQRRRLLELLPPVS